MDTYKRWYKRGSQGGKEGMHMNGINIGPIVAPYGSAVAACAMDAMAAPLFGRGAFCTWNDVEGSKGGTLLI